MSEPIIEVPEKLPIATTVAPAIPARRFRSYASWQTTVSYFDIQLFAADDEGRTEDPTGRRISKARGEGQVAKSQEINQVLSLFIVTLIIVMILPRLIGYEIRHMRYILGNLSTLELSHESLSSIIIECGLHLFAVTWPIMLAEVIVNITASLAQVGFLFTLEPLRPKWNKIFPDPRRLIDRLIIGKTMLFNLGKALFKIGGISLIAYFVFVDELPRLMTMWKMAPFDSVEMTADVMYELVWKICLFLMVLAAGDYGYNRYQWKDSLKMSKQEVKDEHKQTEGDPEIKKQQRRRMMMIMRRRMMREIPTADVVITNPTHYAVAIKYDQAQMDAPKVVAKGEGFLALKIRQIAQENNVPIVEKKELARALYKAVEIGAAVPPEFFRAVAEVLAFVYKQKRKTA